jgi:methylation protein EvaC
VIACNVIAHVEDPHDFLNGVRGLLAKDGIAIIEFQDVAALIAGCQYDHVYHEHRQFFSLASFSRLAGFCGLQVVDWERTPAQGGSMRVTLKRGNKNVTGVMGEPWLETMTPYEGMQARAEYSRKRLNALIGAELNETRVIAGYGASAKSCTLFNFCGLGPQEIRWVEDLTPGKIGRLTPGSKISVRSPTAPVPGSQTPYCGTRPATYLLSSWNYAGSMLRQEREFLDGGGRIIIPGAVPVII